jgi:nitrogenase molybdenum-iron protein alpha chain
VVSVLTGDGSAAAIARAHRADLNLVQCHRSINYLAEMMNRAFGTNWLKVNFVGVEATSKSLRDIAEFFGKPGLKDRTERVIEEEIAGIEGEMRELRSRLEGRKAAIFAGGSRSHHYQDLLRDLGVETVLAGYEFAHRDDYEGRQVLGEIKEDADSKNIETLAVEPDRRYRAFLSPERYEELKETIGLERYGGLMRDMGGGAWVVDDLNHYETEEFVKLLRPDVFFSGIKDKFVIQKAGTVSRQLHSYDCSGPYSGFRGAAVFGRDLCMALFAPAWRLVTPPWSGGSAARTGDGGAVPGPAGPGPIGSGQASPAGPEQIAPAPISPAPMAAGSPAASAAGSGQIAPAPISPAPISPSPMAAGSPAAAAAAGEALHA